MSTGAVSIIAVLAVLLSALTFVATQITTSRQGRVSALDRCNDEKEELQKTVDRLRNQMQILQEENVALMRKLMTLGERQVTGDDLLRIWRVGALLVGAFSVGFAFFVAIGALIGQVRPQDFAHRRAFLAALASYILLAAQLWFVIAGKAISGEPITWRLPIATLAFPLCIYSLVSLVRNKS